MLKLVPAAVTFFLILSTGCSSIPGALEDLKPGEDKDTVLNSVGNPKRTFRENNQDHWVYVYYQDDKQWLRDVIFDDGKVTRVTKAAATREGWEKELERASSMEEYERKARAHQKSKGGG